MTIIRGGHDEASAFEAGPCDVCGEPVARGAFWMGTRGVTICVGCATGNALPALLADALVAGFPGQRPYVEGAIDNFVREFWRAVALALLRAPRALPTLSADAR